MAPVMTSTDLSTKTDSKTQADGSILETTTTTKTNKYSDGSTVIRTKKQTEITPSSNTIHSAHKAIKGNAYEFGYDASTYSAPKVAVTTPKEFTQRCLDEHNRLRAKHHVAPLKLNPELSKIAQAWVNKLARDDKMCHSTFEFGENLYWSLVDKCGIHPVRSWYDEIEFWDWKNMAGNGGGQVGHFTQVIWKRSKEIGVAAAYSKDGHLFVVVEYNPPGNFIHRYEENVFPI